MIRPTGPSIRTVERKQFDTGAVDISEEVANNGYCFCESEHELELKRMRTAIKAIEEGLV